ncbi:MAG: DUF3024 domain-containing protein [Solirubrobacterales bacterium]
MTPDPYSSALAAVEVFCESRVPEEHRDELRLECSHRGNSITIVERRPPWNPEIGAAWTSMKVAQLRYDKAAGQWLLYCSDSGERWWPYDDVGPSASVDPLLAEIDADPTGIFWG